MPGITHRKGRGLALWVGLFLTLSTSLPAETLQERLPPETFAKILKAIILSESTHRSTPSVNLFPMQPNCALMQCGRVQMEMVYLLARQKFPESSMKLVQAEQWFGREGLPHAALLLTVKDKKGEPIQLMIDPTFAQFALIEGDWVLDRGHHAGLRLSQSAQGREMLTDLSRYGMYEMTNERLALLNEAMTMNDKGEPQIKHKISLETARPADYHHADIDKALSRPYEVKEYLDGRSLSYWLDHVGESAIEERIQNGTSQAVSLLDMCQRSFRMLYPK